MVDSFSALTTARAYAEQASPSNALSLMHKLGLAWQPPGYNPLRLHTAGTRVPRLKFAYGPRVSVGSMCHVLGAASLPAIVHGVTYRGAMPGAGP